MRKKHKSDGVQLLLSFEEAEQIETASTKQEVIRDSRTEQAQTDQPKDTLVSAEILPPYLELTDFHRANMIAHGPHDRGRREWLRVWGQAYNYPKDWCSIQSKSGWYQVCVPAGEEAWKDFLEYGASFDVYCLFMSVYATYVCFNISSMGKFLPDHLTRLYPYF
jgi:hypothetical protein